MSKKQFWIWLGAVLLWISFIFCRSLQPMDVSASESGWVLALIQRLLPFEFTEHLIRKLGHFIEFAILGVLAGALFIGSCRHPRTGFLFTVMTGMSTALCDETIQLFVDGRTGQIPDVWIDVSGTTAGAVFALAAWAIWHRRS